MTAMTGGCVQEELADLITEHKLPDLSFTAKFSYESLAVMMRGCNQAAKDKPELSPYTQLLAVKVLRELSESLDITNCVTLHLTLVDLSLIGIGLYEVANGKHLLYRNIYE